MHNQNKMIFTLGVLVTWITSIAAVGWNQGVQVNTMLGVAVCPNNADVYGAVVSSPTGSGVFYDTNNANGPSSFFAGGALNMDIAVSGDGSVVCTVGPGKPGKISCGPAGSGLTLTSVLPPIDIVAQSIEAIGQSSFAVTGHFLLYCNNNNNGGLQEMKLKNGFPLNHPGSSTTNLRKYHNSVLGTECEEDPQILNGVALSTDYGISWNGYSIGLPLKQGYYARYGAFPSTDVWYITWGSWPNNADEKVTNGNHARISSRLSVYYDSGDGSPQITFLSAKNLLGSYPGGISKTIDGGNTWQTVFSSNGGYYLNQISCFDVDHCFTVGENGKAAYVLSTVDGGVTWNTVFTLQGPLSLHAVQMVSLSEIFVAGGTPSSGIFPDKEIAGLYYHSVDGGNSWDLTEFNGYGYDLSFNNGIGYATALFKTHTDLWIWE